MCREYFYQIATDKRADPISQMVKALLGLLSFVYGFLFVFRRGLFWLKLLPGHDLHRPVISVGNLTVGGSGKTPLVEFIAENLTQNHDVVILMRGYMGKQNDGCVSDEARQLKENLKHATVLVGPDRAANAREHLKNHKTDVFILDDGFQHKAVKRDLDIVAVDMMNPWGNGNLLPRGILREPLSALRRAHVIVLTRVNFGEENLLKVTERIRRFNKQCLIVPAVHQPARLVEIFNNEQRAPDFVFGKNVVLFSAIGNAASFEKTVTRLGATIKKHYDFPDHYMYTLDDLKKIIAESGNIDCLVTTQKDAVKIKDLKLEPGTLKIFYLKIQIDILTGKEEFLGRIHSILHR